MALAATAAIAGTVAVGAYLNGKYQITKDVDSIRRMARAQREYQKEVKANRVSFWYAFEDSVKKYAKNRAIWTREGEYTFQQVHDHAIRYAQWLLSENIEPNDLVAFYLQNSPQFMMIWLATHCIGAGPAFINYNLEGKGLIHCLDVCKSKLIIVEDEEGCRERIEASREDLAKRGMRIIVLDKALKERIESSPVILPDNSLRNHMEGGFPAALIYTSGTTGLPKGCAFTIERLRCLGAHYEPPYFQKAGVDQWYNAMPLYHGTGAITSICSLLGGVALALAPKFSVSKFWEDVYNSESTFFIYVGETARYLLNAPPHPLERKHKVRCAYGNGLRPDVWEKFKERFAIPEIAEFFNSTEGIFVLLNYNRNYYTSACVGHHGLVHRTILRNVYIPVAIDHETGDIYRDPKTGFATRNSYDEGGEMLVAVPSKDVFQGYMGNEAATNKRFATNVFKNGDLYYRSGDALRRAPDGHWHFLDRLGDTFRWKSENVSTAEVAECLGRYPGVAEANVYGVLVPNHEGRAGCAAIHLDSSTSPEKFDYNALREYAARNLPKYAVPVFIRIVRASTHIHNHKQNKVPLRKEGVDPKLIGTEATDGKDDQFLWLCPQKKKYVEFGLADWELLEKGNARL